MHAMLFPQHELRRAAWNLASDNVQAGEDVLIVTSSDQYPEIVEALPPSRRRRSRPRR